MEDPLEGVFQRIAALEESISLLETPFWKRLLFYLNGWPRKPVDATEQAWRPWHRWYGRRDRNYGHITIPD